MTRSQRTKALSDFQKDPPTTVFLLSTRAGAVGINLTQANHVFMMEPSFNEALEKQAIGRVYRMGQTRKVSVTRYVIENSIEENMLKVRSKRPDGENGDEGGSGEARALVVVGSITGEAKADAGGLDLAGLFGSADDMPAAGVDDDPEADSDSDSDDDDDEEEEEVVNEEEEEDEEEDDAAVDEGEGVVQPGGGGAAAKATVATVVSTRPRRKRAAAKAAAAVLAASTSAGAIGASDDDDADFEIDDGTDDADDDDADDDADDEEYTLPSGVAAATSMASSSSSSSRPNRKRAAAVAAVQPTSLAKPIRQKAKRFKVSAPKVQAGAASDDSDDAAEEEYTVREILDEKYTYFPKLGRKEIRYPNESDHTWEPPSSFNPGCSALGAWKAKKSKK